MNINPLTDKEIGEMEIPTLAQVEQYEKEYKYRTHSTEGILELIEMAKNATNDQLRIEMKNCVSHFEDTIAYYISLSEEEYEQLDSVAEIAADRSGLWWHILNAELQSRLKNNAP